VRQPRSSSKHPANPPHSRKLGLTGVSLTKARLHKDTTAALDRARNILESVLVRSQYFDEAPFSWVTICIGFGLKDSDEPEFQRINRKCGDLPLSIEVDTNRLLESSSAQLCDIFVRAGALALLRAGARYRRPIAELEVLAQMGAET
jgi:hypothetical protein